VFDRIGKDCKRFWRQHVFGANRIRASSPVSPRRHRHWFKGSSRNAANNFIGDRAMQWMSSCEVALNLPHLRGSSRVAERRHGWRSDGLRCPPCRGNPPHPDRTLLDELSATGEFAGSIQARTRGLRIQKAPYLSALVGAMHGDRGRFEWLKKVVVDAVIDDEMIYPQFGFGLQPAPQTDGRQIRDNRKRASVNSTAEPSSRKLAQIATN
jgi:hypothetical protein